MEEQNNDESRVFARLGLALLCIDFFLFIFASIKPGRWFYTLANDWIYPIVAVIGGFTFLFSLIGVYALFVDYRSKYTDKTEVERQFINYLLFVIAFIGFLSFFGIFGTPHPYIPDIDWV